MAPGDTRPRFVHDFHLPSGSRGYQTPVRPWKLTFLVAPGDTRPRFVHDNQPPYSGSRGYQTPVRPLLTNSKNKLNPRPRSRHSHCPQPRLVTEVKCKLILEFIAYECRKTQEEAKWRYHSTVWLPEKQLVCIFTYRIWNIATVSTPLSFRHPWIYPNSGTHESFKNWFQLRERQRQYREFSRIVHLYSTFLN